MVRGNMHSIVISLLLLYIFTANVLYSVQVNVNKLSLVDV